MRKLGAGLGVALVTIAPAALAVATTGTAAPGAKKAPIKAAWIYVGPHNDGGWSQAHDKGRLYVQKAMGANVITTYKENVPEGPQAAHSPVPGAQQPGAHSERHWGVQGRAAGGEGPGVSGCRGGQWQ